LGANPEGKRPLGRSRSKSEDVIKINILRTRINGLRIWTSGGLL
jgi:hypothetical protein